jgi:tight adherence protein B
VRVLLAALAALVLAAPAAAAEIKQVDTSGYPEVAVTVLGSPASPPSLRENGRPPAGLDALNVGRAKSVVLAVDRSQSMRGKALDDALAAARAFVGRKSLADRVAVVTFATQPQLLTRFSSATIDATSALRDLDVDPVQGTTLYDALVLSARTLRTEEDGARVIIVVTDGNETRSKASLADAISAARGAGAAVYVVAIESSKFTPEPLKELASATGGTYYGAGSSAELGTVYRAIGGELARTWRLTYVTAVRPGERFRLQVNGDEASATVPGTRQAPTASEPALLPEPAYESSWGSLLVGGAVGLLLLLSVALVARAKRATWLRDRLSPHIVEGRALAKARRQSGERFPAGATLLRATEQAFSHLNWWKRVHRQLERADVPLRTAEFLWICVATSFGFALVAAVTARSSLFILGGFALGALLPWLWLKFKASRRLKAFENQLPDLLLTMAASLKAGHSFKQGLQTVVDEGQPPASKEFQRVLAEARLGRPMEDALNEMADRVGSKNLRFVITTVTIQGQVGGSLAGLFDMVAETVRQRQQFARKIRGLTAMGRASAYVLVGLPFFTAAVITLLNPSFMDPLYHTSTGHTLIYIGLGMMAFGSLILRKIVSFRG